MKKAVWALLFFGWLSGFCWAADFYVTNTSSEALTEGSLAYCVGQANSSTELNKNIYFNLPTTAEGYSTHEATGAHFWRIKPNNSNPLNLIQERTFISGGSQTAFGGNTNPFGPEIEISGENMITGNLITLSANRCTLEGVALIKGPASGALINASNLNQIIGCYIGLFATGETAAANGGAGIYVYAANGNTIGGTSAALRNAVSGNTQYGIYLLTSSTTIIKGNYIGTNWNGTAAVPNSASGIYIDNYPTNTVGGSGAGEANYISGNTQDGIVITGANARGNTILGNYIGLSTGEANLGNGIDGILLDNGAYQNTIGTNNHIAYNQSDGIEVNGAATLYNHITQNSTYLNTGEGINLASGGNTSLSVPAIATAEYYSYSNQTYVRGTGAASRTIELFRSDGAGEGKTYLGNTIANTSGEWSTYVSNLATDEGVTATSTDGSGNTSEFAVEVTTVNAGATEYRPDGIIGNQLDGSDYIGEGSFNLSGTNQTKNQSISVGQTANYYIKVKNAGSGAEYISVLGTGDSTGWTVTYSDAKTGGSDITLQVTGSSGWPTYVISNEAKEIRAMVRSTTDTPSTKEVFVTAVSANNTTKKDVIGATTNASNPSNVGSFSISAPLTATAEAAFTATITAMNAGVTTTEVKTVYLSVDAGTVTPTSLAASYFIDDGIWSGTVTLNHAGTRTLTVTAESSSATGNATIIVACTTTEYSNTSLGVTIHVPMGAANEQLSISAAEGNSLPGAAPSGYRQAGKIIVITSNVTNFLLPVTVTMPIYAASPDPQVYYWDGTNWSQSGITRISYTTSSITFTTTHLSTFVAFSQVTAGSISFGPSPYNPNSGSQAAFWYWLDNDKATSIHIFDAAGNQIFRETYLPGSNGGRAGVNVVAWNGRNSWNEVLDNGVYPYRLVQDNKAIAKGKLIIFRR